MPTARDRSRNEISFNRVNAGTSKDAAAARRVAFAEAYIANGRNGTQAAIAAGYSPKGADIAAIRLLGDARTIKLVADLTAKHAVATGLTTQRVLEETRRLLNSDIRRLFRPDGTLIPIHELDDETAATIASYEADGNGRIKIKFWDKNTALVNAMKHLGLFEKDNDQKGESLRVEVLLVGPP